MKGLLVALIMSAVLAVFGSTAASFAGDDGPGEGSLQIHMAGDDGPGEG